MFHHHSKYLYHIYRKRIYFDFYNVYVHTHKKEGGGGDNINMHTFKVGPFTLE